MAVLGAIGLAWVVAYQSSTYSVKTTADRAHAITGPPIYEHPYSYGHPTAGLSDFRDDVAQVVHSQIGQFGITEELRYENDGTVIKTYRTGILD